ncbi:short-chain dehydrogenase/reductase family 9C member 7-like isoform X2 [Haemaphysalis longicornis]
MMHVILLNDVLLWATTSPIPWTLVLGLSICLGPTLVCCGYWLFWNIRRAFFNGLVDSDGKSVLITALWAIVANAGVGSAGKLEWYSTAEIRRLFEVNVFGVTSVVLKFLPLMKKSRGRIVIVASMFGRVTAPLMVPYCMSKYACIAFADGLRRTLYNTGVYVSTIEPTAYRTAMVESENVAKTVDQLIRNMPPEEQRQLPPNASAKLIKRARVFEGAFLRDDPSEAVKDMRAAVMETRPKAHYKTGGTIDAVTRLLNHVLPSEVADYVFHLAVNWTKPKKTSERYHNSA